MSKTLVLSLEMIEITSAYSLVISEHGDLLYWTKLVKHLPDVLESELV